MTLTPAPSLIDDVLEAHREALGRDFDGYRGHAHRVYQLARALAQATDADDTLAIAAAYHDLGVWADRTFDYLEPSAERARAHATPHAGSVDVEEVARLVLLHHKITACPADAGPLAEAFRRADLVDLSLGAVRFGLDPAFVREVREAFPNAGFHMCLLRVGSAWALRHPLRPFPMMRW